MYFLSKLGLGDARKRSRPCLVSDLSANRIISVACGHYHTLVISSDHKVWAWGWGIHGQLGRGSAENAKTPQLVDLLEKENVVHAAAGYAHSVVLTAKVNML